MAKATSLLLCSLFFTCVNGHHGMHLLSSTLEDSAQDKAPKNEERQACLHTMLGHSHPDDGVSTLHEGIFVGAEDFKIPNYWQSYFEAAQILNNCTQGITISKWALTGMVVFGKNFSSIEGCLRNFDKKDKSLQKILYSVEKIHLIPKEPLLSEAEAEAALDKLQQALGGTNKLDYLGRVLPGTHKSSAKCTVTHICPFCCPGGLTCARTEIFSVHRPLPEILAHVDKWKFNGGTVNVGYTKFFKNWFVDRVDSEGRPVFDGSEYHFMKDLAKHLNFSFAVKQPMTGYPPGGPLPNGSWNGAVGALRNREIDLLPALSLTPDRYSAIDSSPILEYSGYFFVQGRPPKRTSVFTIVTPFDNKVWYLVFCTFAIVALTHLILQKLDTYISHEDQRSSQYMGLFDLFQSFMGHFDMNAQRDKKSKGLRWPLFLLNGTWVATAAILSMAYSAVYYSHMILPQVVKPIESVSDLINSDVQWITYKDTIMETFTKYKPLGDKAIIRDWSSRVADFDEVKNNPGKLSVMIDRSPLNNKGFEKQETMEDFRNGNFYVGKESAAENWRVMGFSKNSPLVAKFSPVIHRMFETSIFNQNARFMRMRSNLQSVSYAQMRLNQVMERKQTRVVALKLGDNLLGAFWILAVGLGAAGVAFLAEIAYANWTARKQEAVASGMAF